MPNRVVEGVRLGNVRRCACGRDPAVSVAYDGWEPGEGPFVFTCYCGRDPEAPTKDDVHGIVLPTLMVRSWSKTRGVRLWNRASREREERVKGEALGLPGGDSRQSMAACAAEPSAPSP